MAFRVKVVRRAARQIEDGAAWWVENRPSAPDALRGICGSPRVDRQTPNIGAKALNAKLEGVRRIHLSRIRYHLYYRARFEARTIDVLAFWHTSRGGGPGL